MRRVFRWLRRVVLAFLFLLVLLVVVWFFRWPLFGGLIRNSVRDALAEQGLLIHVAEMEGSLLSDVTAIGIRTESSSKTPLIREARIERIHVSFSLPALVRGEPGWLQSVEIDGVRAVLDLEGEPPGASAGPSTGKETAGGGPDPFPGRVRIRDVDLTVLSGDDRLRVTGGRVDGNRVAGTHWRGVTGADRVEARLNGDEHDFGSRTAALEFVEEHLSLRVGEKEVVRADLSRLDEGGLDGDLDLDLFDGNVSGTVRSDLEAGSVTADLRLERIRPHPLFRFLPGVDAGLDVLSGHARVAIPGFEGDWWKAIIGTFEVSLVAPRVDEWSVDEITLEGRFEDARLTATGKTTGPDSRLDGVLDLRDEPRVDLTLKLLDFPLAFVNSVLEKPKIAGRASGTATIRGPLDSPAFRVNLDVANPVVAEYAAESVTVKADGVPGAFRVEHLRLVRDKIVVSLDGQGGLGEKPEFAANGSIRIESVAALKPELPFELPAGLDGRIEVDFSARSGDDPRIDVRKLSVTSDLGTVSGEDIVVLLPALTKSFDPQLIRVTGALSMKDVDTEAIAKRFDLPPHVRGRLAGEIKLSGSVAQPLATISILSSAVEFTYPDREPVTANEVRLRARRDDRGLWLEELEVGGGDWGLTARGSIEYDPLARNPGDIGKAALAGTVELVRVPLDLTGRIPGLVVARGRVAARLSFSGSIDRPRAEGNLTVNAEKLSPADSDIPPIEDLDLRVEVESADLDAIRLSVRDTTARMAGARIDVEVAAARVLFEPFGIEEPRLAARITGIDAGSIARRFGGSEIQAGTVDLTLGITEGPVVSVRARSLDFRLRSVTNVPGLEEPGEFDVEAIFRDDRITVRNAFYRKGQRELTITANVPVTLTLSPLAIESPPDAPIDIRAHGENLDLASLVPKDGDLRIGGITDLTLTVTGTRAKPEPRARLAIRKGFLRMPGVPSVDDVTGAFRLETEEEGYVLHVDGLATRVGRGQLSLLEGGVVHIVTDDDGVRLGETRLELTGSNALLARTPTMLFRASPRLELSKDGPQPLLISGELDIDSLRYTERVELLRNRPSLAALPLTEDPHIGAVRLDLTLNAPRESIRIQNNVVAAYFGGRLRLLGTLAVPRPEGRIISDRGWVRLPTVTMKLVRGVAEFRKEAPLQPIVDAVLSTRINRILVSLSAKGPPNNLEIHTTSMPALPEEDIITLLATGEVPAEAGGHTAANLATTLLFRQIVSEMSGDDPEAEESALADLVGRVEEISVDTGTLVGGGTPTWRATVRLAGQWLYLRGDQTDEFNYGLDLLFRLSFR